MRRSRKQARLSVVVFALALAASAAPRANATPPTTASVIFIHPDGASAATWAIGRAALVGPDADLHWDRLPAIALYRGHMADSLTATSNGGATTHAFGVKVRSGAYGRTTGGESGEEIVDAQGRSLSVAHQAIRAGLPVGVVQSGTLTEPGTGCFLASAETRQNHEAIAAQLIESGAEVILGGGERYFLPEGARGAHGPGARRDGRDLVAQAESAGYHVVRTRRELLDLPSDTKKVLGLFASYHTFNAKSEEELAAADLSMYEPGAPTVGEMTAAALDVLSRADDRFLLIVEEEGTDNFGNQNNASGVIESMRRADEAIGVARAFRRDRPETLILTTADSDAGGMRMVGIRTGPSRTTPLRLPGRNFNGAPIDGVNGAGSAPFYAAPDRAGRSLPFAVVWAAREDVSGGVLVRAEGPGSHLVRGSMDNTEIAALIRETLFGRAVPRSASAHDAAPER